MVSQKLDSLLCRLAFGNFGHDRLVAIDLAGCVTQGGEGQTHVDGGSVTPLPHNFDLGNLLPAEGAPP